MQEIKFATSECSLGSILVAQSEKGICAILMGDNPDTLVNDLKTRFPNVSLIKTDKELKDAIHHVMNFIETPHLGLALRLDIRGTVFQKKVWQALSKIPSGSTLSYSDIANSLGSPKAVRAVAGACAANPLAVAIPCHRVLRSDGGLSGYRWGIERKRLLLEREAKPDLAVAGQGINKQASDRL